MLRAEQLDQTRLKVEHCLLVYLKSVIVKMNIQASIRKIHITQTINNNSCQYLGQMKV